MALFKLGVGLLIFAASTVSAENNGQSRNGKFSVFQVVEFPNDVCTGNGNNGRVGTCYTKEECEDKGGMAQGSCAEGYGVCCVMQQTCGSSTRENNVFLTQNGATAANSPCTYRICPCNTNICRIRYDFDAFTIAGPTTGTTAAAPVGVTGGAIGDCVTDSFSISGKGTAGSPVICGINTGQHMIVDVQSDGGCQTATFTIGQSAVGVMAPTRNWDIRVTQFGCGNQDESGPPGCLQWFTAATGNIMSYNFPLGAAVTADATHLSQQRYTACVRPLANMCAICYTAADPMAGVTPATQGMFGISASTQAAAAKSAADTDCVLDFVQIGDLAQTRANELASIPASATLTAANRGAFKNCGRRLNVARDLGASVEVCSFQRPFTIDVNFDADELTNAAPTAVNDERDTATGGIVGFKLAYTQVACP